MSRPSSGASATESRGRKPPLRGQRPGASSDESAELKRLRRENAELRRANEILKSASAFFAAELDRPHH